MKINLIRCKTCPFNENGCLATRGSVQHRVLNVGTQLCHGTKNKSLCRGARDFQLKILALTGVIEEASETAWQKKCDEFGLKNIAG